PLDPTSIPMAPGPGGIPLVWMTQVTPLEADTAMHVCIADASSCPYTVFPGELDTDVLGAALITICALSVKVMSVAWNATPAAPAPCPQMSFPTSLETN